MFDAIACGLYFQVSNKNETTGMALFVAGMLLEFGAIQLLSFMTRGRGDRSDPAS